MADRTSEHPRLSPWTPWRSRAGQPVTRSVAGGRNWPLRIGMIIAGVVAFLAVLGPVLAPHDPLLQTYAIQLDHRWVGPPFPPFKTWAYPLGSDQFGRDLFSRLLWGVRPTMIMVTVVALVRLCLGTLIGMLAGWSRGWLGRGLDGLITAALAVPILIVALGAIAAVGIERGLGAFIFGLALTGWAETARVVGAQTRSLQTQPFIESSRALGASTPHLLVRHVLRHVTPMLGMLLAFEISSTLMVAGGLGFLGYYVGGGVWIQVGDWVTENTVGLPELGQMLARALVRLTQPWAMIVIGMVVFLIVLGFNLLGEGLRRELSPERVRRRTRLDMAAEYAGRQLGEIIPPLQHVRRVLLARVMIVVVVLTGAAGVVWAQARSMNNRLADANIAPRPIAITSQIEETTTTESVTERHLWSSERGNPQGSLWVPISLVEPGEPRLLFQDPGGVWSGGPAVDADGTLYISSRAGRLYAIELSGSLRWEVELPAPPIGAPALDDAGTIYVVHRNGSLTAWSPAGQARWTFQTSPAREPTSGPVVGADGTIFYTIVDSLQAVSPEGTARWLKPAVDRYLEALPRLSPQSDHVFLKLAAFEVPGGEEHTFTINPDPNEQFRDPSFLIGGDDRLYYLSGHSLTVWQINGSGVEIGPTITYKEASAFVSVALDAGVTRDGLAWFFEPSEVAWVDASGETLGRHTLRQQETTIIAFGEESIAYVCGKRFSGSPECLALRPGEDEPIWQVEIGGQAGVVGGALVPGVLYVATDSGGLYAIGGR